MKTAPHFCPFVWEDLSLKNDGDIRPCCNFEGKGEEKILLGENGKGLNFRDTNHRDTINHSKLKEMRAQFLRGEWPSGCWRCQATEDVGLLSLRAHRIARSRKRGEIPELLQRIETFTKVDGSVEVEKFPTKEMDIRFNNNCNLRCRHCGPESSSSWYQDAFRFGETEVFESGELLVQLEERDGRVVATYDRSDWSKEVSFHERIAEFRDLKRIYFAGGEPLLQKKHQELLEGLVEIGSAKNIELEYNTNLSVLPERILELWNHFAAVGVGVSIEGVERHYEYIRFPAKFSRLVENLHKIDRSANHIRAWFSYTVNVLSICQLPKAMSWVIEQKFQKIGNRGSRPPVSLRLLYAPEYLCIQNMPMAAKQYAEEQIQISVGEMKKSAVIDPEKIRTIESSIHGILEFMYRKEPHSNWHNIWDANRLLDQWRSQNYQQLEPVFNDLLSNPNPSVRAFSAKENSL